ncbi:MAG: DEAD/DEAH box helicase [Microbispora sp.]|nr:DEAD/DEAH box helicase [Microbispora sp.]
MIEAEPDGLLAARLIERAAAAGPAGLIFVARSETRAARLVRAARALAPAAMEVLHLPGWDCLPYDRASPSRTVMGQRLRVLDRIGQPARGPRLLIASIEAVTQRLPRDVARAHLRFAPGDPLDPEALRKTLLRFGYILDERVDEPGEAAIRGSVTDLFPATEDGATAWRIRHEDGRITGISRYDVLTQRSLEEAPSLTLLPASELVLPEGEAMEERPAGLEHALPAFGAALVPPLAPLPEAAILLDAEAEAAREQRLAEVEEAFRTRIALRPSRPGGPPIPPHAELYLDDAAWEATLRGRQVESVGNGEDALTPPRFAGEEDPEAAFLSFLEDETGQGRRVALAGGQGSGARRLARRVAAQLGIEIRRVDGWPGLLDSPPGSFTLLPQAPDAQGFATAEAVVVPFTAIRPERRRFHAAPDDFASLAVAGGGLRPGDAVIHMDYGLGALRGVEPVEVAGARLDCLRVDYAEGDSRLIPFDELDRIWRYGAEAESVSLDRLGGEAWPKRRAEAEAEIARTAHHLLRLAEEREAARAPVLRPPQEAYRRVLARFPFEPTEDQAAAIEAVLADLASGRPMDRLVCGDVGFGKTEVALRAAAAAALNGRQVALLAPTTVLVRQHLETFRRRFAGLPVRIEALSRLTPPAEARAIRAALAKGEVQIAIGTQALAAKGVRFRDLVLLVIDEEQRFGTRQKAMLRKLRTQGDVHVLTLTATPIPRTLASALIGLQDLSTIATPPVMRQPVRTLRAPLDDALLTQALRREARRGGQSFVVCPRIEDIEPMRQRLAALVPELELIVAHGDLPAAEVDEAMVRFANGDGDVLLSTAIVEAGLDVPRANTMLVWRPDRFGLADLHQLRGRVGRGRARGVFYLLTDPGTKLAPATERRLRTLEALDRVGAGFAISARDLDLRGAGELLGEQQAGHLRLVGIELYRHLLEGALATARGKPPPDAWSPVLTLGIDAFIPPEHVPEEALRVRLHTRLGAILRAGDASAITAMEDELEDRFGPAPEPLQNLLSLARLSLRCRRLGIARLEVGPQAAAATPRHAPTEAPEPLELRNGRLILRRPSESGKERLTVAEALLDALAPQRKHRAAA